MRRQWRRAGVAHDQLPYLRRTGAGNQLTWVLSGLANLPAMPRIRRDPRETLSTVPGRRPNRKTYPDQANDSTWNLEWIATAFIRERRGRYSRWTTRRFVCRYPRQGTQDFPAR